MSSFIAESSSLSTGLAIVQQGGDVLGGLEFIEGILPYPVPGFRRDYLVFNVGLQQLSILVGPNAAGKTSVLETIGYALSPLVDKTYAASIYMLATTLRPRSTAPAPLYSHIGFRRKNEEKSIIKAIYVDVQPPLLLENNTTFQEIMSKMVSNTEKAILSEIKKDLELASIMGLEDALKKIRRHELQRSYNVIETFIRRVVGNRVEFSFSSKHLTRKSRITLLEDISDFYNAIKRLLLRPSTLRLLYMLINDKLAKAIILEDEYSAVIIRQREKTKLPVNVALFHPGFIYWRRVFESLYYTYIKKGLTRENETVKLLKSYISWFNGYELVGRELHIRAKNGKRIPVYSLSDGQRVAAFLGMLYAATDSPTVFLIDTPEAFVHPDGLSVVADILVRLVAEGNQVITATQSIEFLEELLRSAKKHGVIERTVVQQLKMSPEGEIQVLAKWSGSTALRSLEKLGTDFRR